MRKNRMIAAVALLALCAVIVPVVYAFMFRESTKLENTYIPATVTCEVHETMKNGAKTEITVQNTGNVDAYIRVRLIYYWQDSKGNIVARDMDPPDIRIDGVNNKDWVSSESDPYTFYYMHVVAAKGGVTANLLAKDKSISMSPQTVTVNDG